MLPFFLQKGEAMIRIKFDDLELYDEENNRFIKLPAKTVDFEYSLKAVSEWEAKWQIPFLDMKFAGNDPRLMDFYLCMSMDPTLMVESITPAIAEELSTYMNDPQTATTFSGQNEDKTFRKPKSYTSEEIYALMIMNNVPLEFENRNLSRLLTILRIIAAYNSPPKKMSQVEVMSQNAKLNAMRKEQYNTKG